MIDNNGFRANVGIVLLNEACQVLCGRRIGMTAWQFPQGGIKRHETPREAMFRELREEVGLEPEHVEVLGSTKGWLRYRLPKRFIRRHQQPLCIGQKQVWFALRLVAEEDKLRLDAAEEPEFDAWRWFDYWDPLGFVVSFKRGVYHKALNELANAVDSIAVASPSAGSTAARDRPPSR